MRPHRAQVAKELRPPPVESHWRRLGDGQPAAGGLGYWQQPPAARQLPAVEGVGSSVEEAAAPLCPLVWRLSGLAAGAHTDARTDGRRAPDVIIFRLGRLWSRTLRRWVAGTT